jgi:tetratricopeptide (TPR) repeat protein
MMAAAWSVVAPLTMAAQQADADVLVAQAVLAYDDGRYEEALGILNRALAVDSKNARGLYYQGLTYLALQQPGQAVSSLETLRSIRPADPMAQYQLGVAYFSVGDYARASPLLEEVFRRQPELANVGYYVGFMRYRQKQYAEAVEAFKAGKSSDPNIQQLTQFYRGLSYGVLGLSEQAQRELLAAQQTLAVSPFTGAAIRVQEALLAGQRVEESKRLRAQVNLGGYYDDNVAINPNPSSNPIAESFRARKTTAPGMLASALVDYSFYRDGPLEATATYSFLQTLNFNDGLNKFNIQNHLVGLGGFYRGSLANIPYQIGLNYTYDYLFLDHAGFLSRHTPTFSETVVPPVFSIPGIGTVGNLTTLLQRYQQKAFFGEPGDNDIRFNSELRDAYNTMFGLLHVFRFANDKVLVRVGYQYDMENAKGGAFSYTGNRFQTGGQVTLPWGGISVWYDYAVHWRAYENAQTLFVNDTGQLSQRYDIEQTHVVQMIKPLSEHFTLAAQYQRIRNDTNIPIYDYTKNVYTMLVTWAY